MSVYRFGGMAYPTETIVFGATDILLDSPRKGKRRRADAACLRMVMILSRPRAHG
jgi:hypothetical protein